MRVLCLLALIGLVAWLAQRGGLNIQSRTPDFEYFYKGGAWLLAHGTLDRGYDVIDGRVEPRGTLDWYLPFVPRLMTLLALLPFEPAGFVWLGLNVVALLATLRLLGRHLVGLPPQDWPVTQLVPFVLLLAYWSWEMRLNQINCLTLLLLVGSFVCWQGGQRGVAGLWLGLAVLLKLTPALLVVWFALKRQVRTTVVAGVTVVLAGPLADAVSLGPAAAIDAYRGWTHKILVAGSHRGLILDDREMDWRNQGLGAVVARWLHPTNYNTRFDNDPRVEREYGGRPPRYLNIASLSRTTVANVVTAIMIATLAGFAWLARRPARRMTLWQLRFEWTLCVLLMLWFMPVMRRYHVIWALPAISLLAAGVHYCGWRRGWSKLALASMAVVLVAQVSLLSQTLEAAGTILASVAALALPIVLMLRRLAREPTALADPHYAPRPAPCAAAAAPVPGREATPLLAAHA